MNSSSEAVSPLRQRMIDDMRMCISHPRLGSLTSA